jgi:hypothetical protein
MQDCTWVGLKNVHNEGITTKLSTVTYQSHPLLYHYPILLIEWQPPY